MCSVMVFAVVDKADTIVMNDHEELDSWSVIINGAVRVEGGEGGRNYVLSLGQGRDFIFIELALWKYLEPDIWTGIFF